MLRTLFIQWAFKPQLFSTYLTPCSLYQCMESPFGASGFSSYILRIYVGQSMPNVQTSLLLRRQSLHFLYINTWFLAHVVSCTNTCDSFLMHVLALEPQTLRLHRKLTYKCLQVYYGSRVITSRPLATVDLLVCFPSAHSSSIRWAFYRPWQLNRSTFKLMFLKKCFWRTLKHTHALRRQLL